MNRFFKVFSLLILGLFLLISGVDATLDHLSRSVEEGCYTLYSDNGKPVYDYSGDLANCDGYAKPDATLPHRFMHRIKASNS